MNVLNYIEEFCTKLMNKVGNSQKSKQTQVARKVPWWPHNCAKFFRLVRKCMGLMTWRLCIFRARSILWGFVVPRFTTELTNLILELLSQIPEISVRCEPVMGMYGIKCCPSQITLSLKHFVWNSFNLDLLSTFQRAREYIYITFNKAAAISSLYFCVCI